MGRAGHSLNWCKDMKTQFEQLLWAMRQGASHTRRQETPGPLMTGLLSAPQCLPPDFTTKGEISAQLTEVTTCAWLQPPFLEIVLEAGLLTAQDILRVDMEQKEATSPNQFKFRRFKTVLLKLSICRHRQMRPLSPVG